MYGSLDLQVEVNRRAPDRSEQWGLGRRRRQGMQYLPRDPVMEIFDLHPQPLLPHIH
jgi:hypothetical protein